MSAATGTTASYRSALPPGRDGFPQLLLAEWTKFRTVRGWVVGIAVAAVVMVLVSMLGATGGRSVEVDSGESGRGVSGDGGGDGAGGLPIGPEGQRVSDTFSFVNQPLDGDGTITVRVTSLTGVLLVDMPGDEEVGAQPWAKAGLIIKASTEQGSAYAAIMVTPEHGVRMQHNYVHDTAGSSAAVSPSSPRWLRLTRSGSTVTGFESTDGTAWTQVGVAHLDGLGSTVHAGLFVTSPEYEVTEQSLGQIDSIGGPTQATATFDEVSLDGDWPAGTWSGIEIRGARGGVPPSTEMFEQSGDEFTIRGSGDIAPAIAGHTDTIEQSLVGAFAALIVIIVLGTMFITSEYRRGLIRTTLAATPRRGRVLAAKAIVLGGVTFVVGLVASACAFAIVGHIRREKGISVFPVSTSTEVRVVVGTAALLAAAAVLALGVGSLLRRGAGAVTAVIVLLVLPYILAVASVLPVAPAQWLLRLTPAAGFAIQQSTPQYHQVLSAYTPATGYFPLSPLAGFGVLCAWAAAALGTAIVLIRRRDA